MRFFDALRASGRLGGACCAVALACFPAAALSGATAPAPSAATVTPLTTATTSVAAAGSAVPAASVSPAASAVPVAPGVPGVALVPDSTARFEYGAKQAKLTLAISGLDKATIGQPNLLAGVHDVPVGGSALSVKPRELKDLQGATTRFFELIVLLPVMPRNASQTRSLAFTLAGKDHSLTYTLTNMPLSPYKLDVKPPQSAIALDLGEWIPIGVVVGPVAASGVRLLQPSMIEKNTKRLIAPDGLQLCNANRSICAEDGTSATPETGLALPANSAHQLWLGPVRSVGTFEGQNITIASDQKPEGDSASLSVSVSSPWRKALGVLAILLGVFVAWVMTIYVRGRLARDQAYLPVLALRKTLDKLAADLAPVTQQFKSPKLDTETRITEQREALDDDKIAGQGFPPKIPLPWTIPGAPDAEAFRQYLLAVNDWAAALSATVPAMLYVVTKSSDWPSDPAKVKAVNDAIAALDKLAAPGKAPALADTQSAVKQALAVFNAASPTLDGAGDGASASSITVHEVQVEMVMLSALSWFVIGILTTAVGAYALLFSGAGAGFGTPADYLVAFFWGLGLPAASQLATNATNQTVGSTFKITQPS